LEGSGGSLCNIRQHEGKCAALQGTLSTIQEYLHDKALPAIQIDTRINVIC
jgi:hypothetical protein